MSAFLTGTRHPNSAAFPTRGQDGVTIRDYFAAAALQGLLAAHAGDGQPLPGEKKAAEWAYDYADAMLEARKPDVAGELAATGN